MVSLYGRINKVMTQDADSRGRSTKLLRVILRCMTNIQLVNLKIAAKNGALHKDPCSAVRVLGGVLINRCVQVLLLNDV